MVSLASETIVKIYDRQYALKSPLTLSPGPAHFANAQYFKHVKYAYLTALILTNFFT